MPRESSDEPKRTVFPNKEKREQCWAARDLFWGCIDENGKKSILEIYDQ